MASNMKSRVHVMRQDDGRRQVVAVPVVPIKISPEMANAIRRREGVAGVEYWNRMAANGMVVRPSRKMTVEQAFPKRYVNGYQYETHANKTEGAAHDTNRKSLTTSNYGSQKQYEDKLRTVESKKPTVTDLATFRETRQDVSVNHSRNYQMYDAKVRYVDNAVQRVNLSKKSDSKFKLFKKKDIKAKEDASKQNGHVLTNSSHTITKTENNRLALSQRNSVPDAQQNYRVITPNREKVELENFYRRSWSEMAHLSVNGSVARLSEPTFAKIGMNHTFRIPRPKARTDTLRGSVAHRNINLTASKKRAVSFGQDRVYEYTPLEPVQNYPIHEELL